MEIVMEMAVPISDIGRAPRCYITKPHAVLVCENDVSLLYINEM